MRRIASVKVSITVTAPSAGHAGAHVQTTKAVCMNTPGSVCDGRAGLDAGWCGAPRPRAESAVIMDALGAEMA